MWADCAVERFGAVALHQRGQTGTGTTQRYSLVDEEEVSAVDRKTAGREPHHLASRAFIDGGLDPCRVVGSTVAGIDHRADCRSRWNATGAHHSRIPDGRPLVRKEAAHALGRVDRGQFWLT